jgi:lipoate-protein ligase A
MITAGERPPTLRLYGWRYPTISLGRNERWRRSVRLERLRDRGVRLVRRPTGGRAVLHQRELTYSVTASGRAGGPLGDHLDESLALISSALTAALHDTGVKADVTRRDHPVARTEGPCFETATRYELVAAGRKLVGHAQLRTPSGFLQHGSMPVFDPIGPLRELGPRGDGTHKEGIAPGPLTGWSGLAPDSLSHRLALAFTSHFGSRPRWANLSEADLEQVERLKTGRYASDRWTFRR